MPTSDQTLPTPTDTAAERATPVAPLQEVFSSSQGEGPYVGRRHLFVRFAHCHLKCAYCDTPMTSSTGEAFLELYPGSPESECLPNPVSAEDFLDRLPRLLGQARHHAVSFTGGEPLLYPRFLAAVMPSVQRLGVKTYLETSGTQPDALARVLPWTDIVAMDIKLPSATGEAPRWEAHRDFYALAHPMAEVFVKLIFNADTTDAELAAVRDIVTDRRTPVILQPVTNLSDHRVSVPATVAFRLEDQLAAWFDDVRVIPQTHKLMPIR